MGSPEHKVKWRTATRWRGGLLHGFAYEAQIAELHTATDEIVCEGMGETKHAALASLRSALSVVADAQDDALHDAYTALKGGE